MAKLTLIRLTIFFLILLTLLAFAYGEILNFGFWKDDWINIWLVANRNPIFFTHWIHPGTLAEFFIFGSLFGDRVIAWQITGLVLRVFSSFCIGLFIGELVKSGKAGLIAIIISTFTVVSLDSITWIAPRVVVTATVFVVIGMYYWLKFLRSGIRIYLINSLVFWAIAVLADPGRMLPLPVLISLTLIFEPGEYSNLVKSKLKYLAIPGVVILSLLIIWQWQMFETTVVYKFIVQSKTDPQLIRSKVYVLGNYFCSLFYLFTGWVYRLPEMASTGIYNRLYARLGLIPVLFFMAVAVIGFVRKNRLLLQAGWLFFWIFIFYLPGYYAEPRLTMGVSHRYMQLSGIGITGIIAIILAKMDTRISVIGTLLIVILNISVGRSLISDWKAYRENAPVMTLWQTVNRDIGADPSEKIVSFSGFHPILGNNIGMSGQIPLMVVRKVSRTGDFFMNINDPREIVRYVFCPRVTKIILGGVTVPAENVPVSRVFGFKINDDGSIADNTPDLHKQIRDLYIQNGCPVL